MPNVVVTRVRYSGPRQSRNFYEHLMVRFPGAWRVLARRLLRLSPRSRLKRAMLCRERDFEALGLGGTFQGHEGMRKLFETFSEAWERWEVVPVAVLDIGNDHFIGLGRLRLPGNVSGLELDSEFAQLVTVRDGLCVRDQEFMAWDKGLRAAGLDPDALSLPLPGKTQTATRAG